MEEEVVLSEFLNSVKNDIAEDAIRKEKKMEKITKSRKERQKKREEEEESNIK